MSAFWSSQLTRPQCRYRIIIDDDTALELYDMHLDEAARKIVDMRTEQGNLR